MIVAVNDGVARLDEADDFRRFHVAAASVDDAIAAPGLEPTPDPAEVWVSIDTLRGLPGERADDWADGLEGMVAGAARAGWLDDTGTRIRAHVERPA